MELIQRILTEHSQLIGEITTLIVAFALAYFSYWLTNKRKGDIYSLRRIAANYKHIAKLQKSDDRTYMVAQIMHCDFISSILYKKIGIMIRSPEIAHSVYSLIQYISLNNIKKFHKLGGIKVSKDKIEILPYQATENKRKEYKRYSRVSFWMMIGFAIIAALIMTLIPNSFFMLKYSYLFIFASLMVISEIFWLNFQLDYQIKEEFYNKMLQPIPNGDHIENHILLIK